MMINDNINDSLLQHLSQIISAQTGFRFRKRKADRETLCKAIASRMKLLKLSTSKEYCQLLEANTPDSNLEWKNLMPLLTTGETFFFRDKGQFELLQNRILPELIERRKTEHSIRIWSAGCSSGEEAYSLAIIVNELIPYPNHWNIFILGTDINEEAIEKAKGGVYKQWSFRGMSPDFQRRYFRKRQNKDEWELDERIRSMVTFSLGNLLKDHFPNYTNVYDIYDIYDMDLILCRSVFIYLEDEAISAIIEKFVDTLKKGGYLMTGHNELHGQKLGRLKTKLFPESAVYQRIDVEKIY